MKRLYFWIKSAPSDRPGGPWWYRDFYEDSDCGPYDQKLDSFLADLKPFLRTYAIEDKLTDHDPMEIHPPDETKIVFL